jgi:uncharacterized protein YcaQ
MPIDDLSLDEARRIALAAQGFDRPRPSRAPAARDVERTIAQLGLIQIDYVNVLTPAHYLVLFSRLGPYKRAILHDLVYRKRRFTEQWAHEASIVPMSTWPLLRHRMEVHRVRPWGFEKFMAQHPEFVAAVLDQVRLRGPLAADDLHRPDGIELDLRKTVPGSWFRSTPRAVLEAHFGRGRLAIADRRDDFSRVYDLAERVIPEDHHGRSIGCEDAQRELLRLAARSHGIGTAADLADYYRMPVAQARPRIAELVSSGELREVRVEGWCEAAFLHREARLPGSVDRRALLAPFDPLIWFRPRVARLFGFEYRFEIFVPPEKRKWGCYVLPFLFGDRLVARVDLKSDRANRRLRVVSALVEPGVNEGAVAEALGAELRTMASWLDLDSVVMQSRSAFARKIGLLACSP